jgi:CheY-specific phosphatase CheX
MKIPGGPVALKRYVMLVDQEGGPLARLIPRLRELDFRIVRVPEPSSAVEFVRVFPKLSMVAVNDTGDAEQNAAIVSGMRELQPTLPLLWHGPQLSLPEGERIEILPHENVTAGDLVACAERLLYQHFYPLDFATYLAETALTAFGAFGAHATSADPFLKASRARLAELSAVIAFSGPETSGHLIVSASRQVARDAHARLFGTNTSPNDDSLVDLLGECSNRIVGRLVSYFEKRGRPFSFGVPLYLAGSQCVLWQGASRPSLALEFEGISGRLFCEICIDAFDPINSQSELPDELLQSGQCILL